MDIMLHQTPHSVDVSTSQYVQTSGWYVTTCFKHCGYDVFHNPIYAELNSYEFVKWCKEKLGYYPLSEDSKTEEVITTYFKTAADLLHFRLKWL
jgi:hypothetical protein